MLQIRTCMQLISVWFLHRDRVYMSVSIICISHYMFRFVCASVSQSFHVDYKYSGRICASTLSIQVHTYSHSGFSKWKQMWPVNTTTTLLHTPMIIASFIPHKSVFLPKESRLYRTGTATQSGSVSAPQQVLLPLICIAQATRNCFPSFDAIGTQFLSPTSPTIKQVQ